MTDTVVVSGGGSGGHIYPALAICRELTDRGLRVVYVGAPGNMEERIVPPTGIPMRLVRSGGLLGKSARGKLSALARSTQGVAQAVKIMGEERPSVVVGTGGYVTGPVCLAAALMRIPVVLQEQDAWPGLTNRLLSRLARLVAVPYREAVDAFPRSVRRRIVVIGNPIRRELLAVSRAEGSVKMGLDPARRTVLVFGGSLGARYLNEVAQALLAILPRDMQLLWSTGVSYYEDYRREPVEPRLVQAAYFDDMASALAAADLAVTRAGAGTIAELTARGLPAVLVPSPNVTHNHQTANANVMAARGAALVLAEHEHTPQETAKEVLALMGQPDRLASMAERARAAGDPDAVVRFADQIIALMEGAHGTRR